MQFILFIFATEPPSKLSFVVEVSRIISYIFKVQTTLRKYKKGEILLLCKNEMEELYMLLCNSITARNSSNSQTPISKAEESEVNITLLGTADIHSRFMP